MSTEKIPGETYITAAEYAAEIAEKDTKHWVDVRDVIAKAIMAERKRCACGLCTNDDRARIWDDERKVYVHNPALGLFPLQEASE